MVNQCASDQASDAQNIYDERSATYDDSWHPRFARHMVEIAGVRPGEHVLDLACGTGLASFPASEAVGPSGLVVGIDISGGMLDGAKSKRAQQPLDNTQFFQHSITDLGTLEPVQNTKFDAIICASALVLLKCPDEAIRGWLEYLRPGGRVIVDVTHPQSQVVGITMERVGRALGKPVPYYRAPFQGPQDLNLLLKAAGLQNIELRAVSQKPFGSSEKLQDYLTGFDNPRIDTEYDVLDANIIFDQAIRGKLFKDLARPDTKSLARQLFEAEWIKLADRSGKVIEVDCVFVGTGRMPV